MRFRCRLKNARSLTSRCNLDDSDVELLNSFCYKVNKVCAQCLHCMRRNEITVVCLQIANCGREGGEEEKNEFMSVQL